MKVCQQDKRHCGRLELSPIGEFWEPVWNYVSELSLQRGRDAEESLSTTSISPAWRFEACPWGGGENLIPWHFQHSQHTDQVGSGCQSKPTGKDL